MKITVMNWRLILWGILNVAFIVLLSWSIYRHFKKRLISKG